MLLAQREGCIVNISSVFGLVGFPLQAAYNISKFGVRGLTECLWSELDGTGVRAVCVHPGGIRTAIDKAGRRSAASGVEESAFDVMAADMLVTPPEDCAADIIAGVERGRRRIVTGHKSTSLFWLSRLFPNTYPRLLKALSGKGWPPSPA
jgi:short-subunit dehydrogenase